MQVQCENSSGPPPVSSGLFSSALRFLSLESCRLLRIIFTKRAENTSQTALAQIDHAHCAIPAWPFPQHLSLYPPHDFQLCSSIFCSAPAPCRGIIEVEVRSPGAYQYTPLSQSSHLPDSEGFIMRSGRRARLVLQSLAHEKGTRTERGQRKEPRMEHREKRDKVRPKKLKKVQAAN